jgi:uncharacterized protein
MKKMILVFALFLGSSFITMAGDNKYVIGEKMSFNSQVLDEERGIIVYTPKTYDLINQSYPVMYLLDGDEHFHHASGITKFLAENGIIPELIVVAIQNVDRTRDFSPSHLDKFPTSGGAEKFMKFLADELIPFVDKNFRTEPYRILMGHSFGGSFAAYALLTDPQVFNAYISVSPYLLYDDEYTVKLAKKKLKSAYYPSVHFYMTIGDEPDYFASLDEFQDIIKQKSPEGLKFTYVKMEKENHRSNPHLSIYNGLESIFSEWKLPKDAISNGLNAIDKHYQMLTDKYNFKIETPEYVVNALGYNYLYNTKKIDKAITTFKENVKRFPKSANVYDSLGEAYENDNQFEKAEINYQTAVNYAKKVNHPNLSVYLKNLKRMQEKLAVN